MDLFHEDQTADENDIALYNALHGVALPPETKVNRFRIEGILYMNFQNDVSCGIEDKLIVFGEHQSSINLNMPLRSLMYIGRAYEQIVPIEERYRKKLVRIPTTGFYTFYNGKESCPKEVYLKLSDAFIVSPQLEHTLELTVKVINIKNETGHEILIRCDILREYSEFMEYVEKYRTISKDGAIEKAIKECITKGVLKEYLERKGSQVVNMLKAEYDYETDIRIQREEAWEDGQQNGLELGREQGLQQGVELTKKVFKLHMSGKTVAEIAKECGVSEKEIEKIVE